MGDWMKKVRGLNKKKNLIDTDSSTVITRGERGGGKQKRVSVEWTVIGDLTWGGEHTVQYTNDLL